MTSASFVNKVGLCWSGPQYPDLRCTTAISRSAHLRARAGALFTMYPSDRADPPWLTIHLQGEMKAQLCRGCVNKQKCLCSTLHSPPERELRLVGIPFQHP